MGLKNLVIKLVGREVNCLAELRSGVAHASRLGKGRSAIEIGTRVLRGALFGAVENLHGFKKMAPVQKPDAFRQLLFNRLSDCLAFAAYGQSSNQVNYQGYAGDNVGTSTPSSPPNT